MVEREANPPTLLAVEDTKPYSNSLIFTQCGKAGGGASELENIHNIHAGRSYDLPMSSP